MSPKPAHANSLTCAIIDAARIFGELDTAKELQGSFLSLFMGRSEEMLSSVAPHLFPFQIDTEFGKWLLEKGWGNSWGLFINTNTTLEELRKHFRKFLMVKTEDGKELFFRFYDPRVLRAFLPTCDRQQLMEFFNTVNYFAMEDEDPSLAVIFQWVDSKLVTERIPKEEFWKALNNGKEFNFPKEERIEPKAEEKSQITSSSDTKEIPETKKPNSGWSFLVE